jgi:hypothetical protein
MTSILFEELDTPMVEPVVDLADLDDDALVAEFRELELRRRADAARAAALVAEGERRAVFAVDGHRSMKQWIMAHTNTSAAEAGRLRRLAATLGAVPGVPTVAGVVDALAAGHIGVAQADELARLAANRRITEAFASLAPQLVQHAEHLGYADFKLVCQRFEMLADLDGATQRDDASFEARTASVLNVDGSLRVRASGGTGMVTARVLGIFDWFAAAEFAADVAAAAAEFGPDAPASKLPRTDAQRRHDALIAIFDAAAAAPADAVAPEPVVNVVVGYQTLCDLLDRTATGTGTSRFRQIRPEDLLVERLESSTGVPLTPDVVVAACIAGSLRILVVDPNGVVVSAGRKRRLFTGAARDVALLLRHGCGHLGCTVPAGRCHVDHLDEWSAHGGHTDQSNAGPRCASHNTFKSKRHLRSTRDPSGYLIDYRSDGTAVLPVGRRLTVNAPYRPPNRSG